VLERPVCRMHQTPDGDAINVNLLDNGKSVLNRFVVGIDRPKGIRQSFENRVVLLAGFFADVDYGLGASEACCAIVRQRWLNKYIAKLLFVLEVIGIFIKADLVQD